MTPHVVFLHGIGRRATYADEWLPQINDELRRRGMPQIAREKLIAYDYRNVLYAKNIAKDPPRPPVTLADDEDPHGPRELYLKRTSELQQLLASEGTATSRWRSRIPSYVGDIAAARSHVFRAVKDYSGPAGDLIFSQVLEVLPPNSDLVIVGHSLGSLVAIDLLPRLSSDQRVLGLITVASPAAFVKGLRRRSARLMSEDTFPYRRVASWVNIYDPADVVTGGRGIAGEYPTALDVPVSTGSHIGPLQDHHEWVNYATLPAVAIAIGYSLQAAVPRRQRPISRPAAIDEMWHPLLLKFAYAEALYQGIPSKQTERRRRLMSARREMARRAAALVASEAPEASDAPRLAEDFINYAFDSLAGRYTEARLAPYMIGVLQDPPLPPFEIESGLSDLEREEALRYMYRRLRPTGDGVNDAVVFASVCLDADRKSKGVMGFGQHDVAIRRGAGAAALLIGALVLGIPAAGAVAMGLGVAAGMAAVGPAGLTGALAAMMALAGVGAAPAGHPGGAQSTGPHDKGQIAGDGRWDPTIELDQIIPEMVEKLPVEQLRLTIANFIGAIILQEHPRIRGTSARESLAISVGKALSEAHTNLFQAHCIEKNGPYATDLELKVRVLDRAASWLRGGDTAAGRLRTVEDW